MDTRKSWEKHGKTMGKSWEKHDFHIQTWWNSYYNYYSNPQKDAEQSFHDLSTQSRNIFVSNNFWNLTEFWQRGWMRRIACSIGWTWPTTRTDLRQTPGSGALRAPWALHRCKGDIGGEHIYIWHVNINTIVIYNSYVLILLNNFTTWWYIDGTIHQDILVRKQTQCPWQSNESWDLIATIPRCE